MDVNNLNWDQIKELAEMAMKNNSEFDLVIDKNGAHINMIPRQRSYLKDLTSPSYPYIPNSPTIMYEKTQPSSPWNPYEVTCRYDVENVLL